MKSVGIICECNPLHGGHEYLLRCAKASGADTVVAVMSGCFVQRGEAALAEPVLRAKMLLGAGADLVLELPFPWSCCSAEHFATAGVFLLSSLGVEELWFGSESGTLSRLERLAAAADAPEFCQSYRDTAGGTDGTAKAYFDALCAATGEPPCAPNEILGIAYLRAIRRLHSTIRPVTVQRKGSGFSQEQITEGMFPSATALRKKLFEEGLCGILPHVSPHVGALLREAVAQERAPASLCNAQTMVLGSLRMIDAERVSAVEGLAGGLGNRLLKQAHVATSYEELLQLSDTKKYPRARIARGILFALTAVTREDVQRLPAYTTLLGTNRAGRAFLARQRKAEHPFPVVTKQSDVPKTAQARLQNRLEQRAGALYTLCMPTPLPTGAVVGVCPTVEQGAEPSTPAVAE